MNEVEALDFVMTVTEAAERWGKADRTLRQACAGYKGAPPRFVKGEFRQSNKTWLVTIAAMTRVFGEEPEVIKKMNTVMEQSEALDFVMIASEAAELWGKSDITIRQACSGYKKAPPRFKEGEFRQSGKTWLVTRADMARVFGDEPGKG